MLYGHLQTKCARVFHYEINVTNERIMLIKSASFNKFGNY